MAPLAAFIVAALALNLAPGPDMTYVAARSLAQGRRAGVISALGIAVGCLFHIAAASFGLAVLLKAVPQAYTAVRILGAGYLIYLGAMLVRRAARAESEGRAVFPTVVNVLVAWLAGGAAAAFRSGLARAWMQRASGAILVGLGVRLALSRSQ